MKNNLLNYTLSLLGFFLLLNTSVVFAQTPGFIYKAAIGGGERVLDPNGDNYVSTTRSGFSGTNDTGSSVSEIPYRALPVLENEVVGDLNTGSTGGHTDLVPPFPIQAFFDGTNVMLRFRLGGTSTSSKGYSIMIDTDGQFGNLVAGGNPATTPNPGFEFEIVLESNFSVSVYDHRNNPLGGPRIWSGSVDQYSQRAVAATTNSNNPDYFFDFYVPLTTLTGVTANTPLRMSGVTITSAQSGITGTVSDIGGVNFQSYEYSKQRAWAAIMGSFPSTTLTQIRNSGFGLMTAVAPVVNGPILANSTSVSGTSVEAAGSVITVLRNGISICGGSGQPTCPTVGSTGAWTLNGIDGNLLVAGNTITAQVSPVGKNTSSASSPVTVTAGVCISTPPPVITGLGGSGNKDRSFQGTSTLNSPQRITIYNGNGGVVGTHFFTPSGSSPFTWTTPVFSIPENNFYATATPVNATNTATTGCESLRSNQLCFRNGQPSINTQQVSITSVTYNGLSQTSSNPAITTIPTNVSAISGTLTAAPSGIASGTQGFVTVFVNAVEQTALRTQIASTATTWTVNIPNGSLSLKAGDVLNVRTTWTLTGGGQTTCDVPSSISNLLRVSNTTTAPTITNGTYCGTVSSLSGTSSEPAGTIVEIYQNNTATGRTGIVNSAGGWTVDLSTLSGGGIAAGVPITARATGSGKALSAASNTITSSAPPTGTLTINAPITEGQTSISGTAPGSSKVTIFIDGTPFTPVTANAAGAWVVTGLSELEVYAGASVTASFSNGGPCQSAKITPVIVQCKAPQSNYTVTANPTTICSGSTVNVTLSGSEYGISYRLLVNGTESGSSVMGTGGSIVLTTGILNNTTSNNTTATITVRARKVSGTSCDATLSSSANITVRPQPTTTGLSFTSTTASVCANQSVNFTLNGTTTSNTYQLRNTSNGQLVGTAVAGNGSNITVSTGNVTSTTNYELVISNGSTTCSTVFGTTVTVTVTSPSTARDVFARDAKVCAGGSTIINVATEGNSNFEYKVYRRATTANGLGSNQLLATFTGNGAVRTASTGNLNVVTNETFFVTVQNLAGTCGVLTIVNEPTVQVTNNGTAANAGSTQTVCSSSATLAANDVSPGVGTWSQVSGPSSVSFSSVNSPNSTVTGLISGTYVLRWTAQTSCGGSPTTTQSDVTIHMNCPASFAMSEPRYKDKYTNGMVLAAPSDPDGAITNATLTQGTLPPGTAMNSSTGVITVTDRLALTEGTYSMNIRLTDSRSGISTLPVVLRIYGNSPAVQPLPVELVSFSVTLDKGKAVLTWVTATEIDNSHFEVQRSKDGKVYEKIATVEGKGNSNQRVKYQHIDNKPNASVTYYRLKQVDFNGDYKYSKVVVANLDNKFTEQSGATVYPNPFKQDVNVQLFSKEEKAATLNLTDLQGRVLYSTEKRLAEGLNIIQVELPQVPEGLYLLQIASGTEVITKKIMKSK